MSMPTMPSKLKNVTKPITYLGVGLIVLGILSIVLPRASGMTIGVLVGILLLLSGILRTTFAWIATSWGSAFLRFALGVLAIVAGGVMIFQPETGLDAITIVVVDGVVTVTGSVVCEQCGGRRTPGGFGTVQQSLGAVVRAIPGVQSVEFELQYEQPDGPPGGS